MELTFENTTHIGLGHATQADAFQCGREAAQMAKHQLPAHIGDLVLVFCPSGIHFKDFIEGVRLVTGEDKLIGVPVDWVLSNDLPSLDACVVLVLQLSGTHFTIASSKEDSVALDSDLTAFLSQCRQGRGNASKLYDHHGILFFENRDPMQKSDLANHIAVDAGLETWVVGASPKGAETHPIICRDNAISNGLAGIEFFSSTPFGIGSVGTGAFSNQLEIYKEAAKSSARDALAQMGAHPPSLGFVFIDVPENAVSRDDLSDIFRSIRSLLHNTPIVMIPTRHQFSRCSNRSIAVHKGSVITVLVPH